MTSQPVFHGANIWYGSQFSASNVTIYTQDAGFAVTSDTTKVMDSRNNAIARTNSNPGSTLSLKYYSFDTNAAAGNGAVQGIDIGTMIGITSSQTTAGNITGSNYVVNGYNVDFGNNKFAEITLNLDANPAITT
jgi:hypothetical protein